MYQHFFSLVGNFNFVDCLNNFKNKRGFGIEEVMILFRQSFDEWERFRCQENEVALVMYYPAAEEDTIGYMDFKEFYPYVYKRAQEYISSHPKRKDKVTRMLKDIKESWGI
jgi:CDI immunity protein